MMPNSPFMSVPTLYSVNPNAKVSSLSRRDPFFSIGPSYSMKEACYIVQFDIAQTEYRAGESKMSAKVDPT